MRSPSSRPRTRPLGCRQYREHHRCPRRGCGASTRPDHPAHRQGSGLLRPPGFIERSPKRPAPPSTNSGRTHDRRWCSPPTRFRCRWRRPPTTRRNSPKRARLVAERVADPAPPHPRVAEPIGHPRSLARTRRERRNPAARRHRGRVGRDRAGRFVSDHIEDVGPDAEAAATAADSGISFARAVAPGTEPVEANVAMWVDLVRERIEADRGGSPTRAALGTLEVRPDVCRVDCCPAPVRPAGRPDGPPGRPH